MARQLFDTGLFNALSSSGALGAGWRLAFYQAGTSTTISTYNARSGGSSNSNPVVADANGRFGEIWIDEAQSIKYVLSDESSVVKVTRDSYYVPAVAPTVSAGLVTFLAGSAPLPVASGGTGSTTAVNALTALGALPAAGGTVAGNIVRSAKGVHPYFNSASMTGGQIYIQAAGADPTTNPGDVVFEY